MAKQRGCVEQLDRSFWLTYSLSAIDDTGKLYRKRKRHHLGYITDMCYDDARQEADGFLKTLEVQTSLDMTVGDFVEIWRKEHVAYLKPGGQLHTECILRNHVVPALSSRKLLEVNHDVVQELVRLKTETGLSPQTIRHIRNVISGIYTHAIAKGMMRPPNPAQHRS